MTASSPTGLIGVVHLLPMPGDPRYRAGGFDTVRDAALRDAHALIAGGITQMIVENFGSAPFQKGTLDDPLPPHVHAFMARVVSDLTAAGADVGVNCLRNDGYGAMGVAAACGARFVRVNVLSGAYVTDQGLIEGDAARLLRYRQAIGAQDIAIIADVLVKHASPLGELRLAEAIADTSKRGGADAVIISGVATGAPAQIEDLQTARRVATVPVLVGSGVSTDTMAAIRPYVDGVIVGTATKLGGDVAAPVDSARVEALVRAWEAD